MTAPAFLRTRFARRLLWLFLLCAVLPLTVLAGLGYRHLAQDLENAAAANLRAQAKTSGMMLLDRLGALSGLLETMASQLQPGRSLQSAAIASAAGVSGPRFRAVAMVRPDGRVENIIGELPAPPALLAGQDTHLKSGGVALVTGHAVRGLRVYLVRAVDARPGVQLWGLVDHSSVFGLDPSSSVAPPGTLSCLTIDPASSLACSSAETMGMASNPETGTFRWQRGPDRYLAASWNVFLRQLYAAPGWNLSLSVSESTISAPLDSLRQLFLLGLALSIAVVFTLAHIQLRRSMAPLEALETGTARVAAGRFDEPVVVRSGDEFQSLADSFNRMASDLGRQFEHRDALSRVHEAALAASGPESVLRALFAGRNALLPGESVGVALASEDPGRWLLTWSGDPATAIEVRPTRSEMSELRARPEGLLRRRGEPMPRYLSAGGDYLVHDCLVLPFRSRGGLAGVVAILGDAEHLSSPVVTAQARHTVDETALAISNARLVLELDQINWGAFTALARTIDAVSPWTAGHSERVTLSAVEIGRRMGFPEEEINLLHRGGLLHDIGKVGVPAAILDKPDSLTDDEIAEIRRHPTIGARILAPIPAFRQALPLVLHHHELLDGSGYPDGLSGDQIPHLVRVLTVADVFDALVSNRPYRSAWSAERAIRYLRQNMDRKFDRRAVLALDAALGAGWRPVTSTAGSMTDDPASGPAPLWSPPEAREAVTAGSAIA